MPNISQAGKAHLDSFIVCVLDAVAEYCSDETLQENAARDPNTPPFIFAVTSIEEVIYSKGQGLKQSGMGKDGVVDIDTVYKLCSQSKLITHVRLHAPKPLIGQADHSHCTTDCRLAAHRERPTCF